MSDMGGAAAWAETPSAPGFYWCRLETDDFVIDFPVAVEEDGAVLTLGVSAHQTVRHFSSALWYGPIEPPA